MHISYPITIRKFQHHELFKNQLLDLINSQETYERIVHEGTDITKCDWPTNKDDFDRHWVTLIKQPLIDHLDVWAKDANFLGFIINQIWFQQYTKSSGHGWHTHPNCHYTNVYYLDLPKGCPKTQYIDPMDNKTVCEFDVEEGDIITFPNILLHRAPPNQSDDVKTIISWNLNVTFAQAIGEQNDY